MFFLKHIACLYFFIAIAGGLRAQQDGEFFEKSLEYTIPFTTTQYSSKNGLSLNHIIGLESTPEGLLFVSTGNGVSTFNGYELKEIETDKKYIHYFIHALKWNNTHKTLVGFDSQGQLLALLPHLKQIGAAHDKFSCLASNSDSIYAGTANGDIYAVQFPALTLKKIPVKFPGAIVCIAFQGNNMYAGTSKGLYRYNTLSKQTEQLSSELFIHLKSGSAQTLYGITSSKAYSIGDGTHLLFGIPLNSDKEAFHDFEITGERQLYVATGKGLYAYANGQVYAYTTGNSLISNALSSLLYNRYENILFAGTGDKGLMKLQFKNAFSMYKSQGLSESSSSSIIKTSDNKILFAETCCNIHELAKDTIINYGSTNSYYSVLTEINNTLFCGTWGNGISILDHGLPAGSITRPALPDNTPLSIYKTKKGMIWIGTLKGLACGTSTSNIAPALQQQIPSQVNVIYELKNGQICFGGPDNAWIVEGARVKKISLAEGLKPCTVRSFYEDKEGKLWIGTFGGGVYCYANNSLTHINAKKGCRLFKDAFCLAPDDYGNIYMTSNYGLWSVPFKAMDDFYKDSTGFLIPAHFTEENGLLNTEFNGGFQNNYLQFSKNHFYFPSIEGIVAFASDTLPFRKLKPKIESVTVNDSLATSSTFARSTFLVRVKASCVAFSQRSNVFFQYRLSGADAGSWSDPQKENTFSFYLLPPGHYTLSVRAIDAFNDRHPGEARYTFDIQPYLYETLWFKIIVGIFFISAVIIISRIRLRSHQKKAEEKEFYARRIAEIELKAVQSQLNPHFIFNCLNTIKYFILDNDFTKANKALNHFSKLLRDVLDNSDRFSITLSDEIKFISDYIELEKIRLPDQMDVSLSTDILNELVQLPAMLIQPHIENAIKHGISNLETRKGSLTISFVQREDFITCTITDNGIGRAAANSIKKLASYVSKGISLTRDKSEILKKIHNIEIVTTITDIYADNGEAAGTQVIIQIPVQHENSDH